MGTRSPAYFKGILDLIIFVDLVDHEKREIKTPLKSSTRTVDIEQSTHTKLKT